MNKIYKLIYDKRLGAWRVVSEVARAAGKSFTTGSTNIATANKITFSAMIFGVLLAGQPVARASGTGGTGGGFAYPAGKSSVGYYGTLTPPAETAAGTSGSQISQATTISQNVTGGAGATGDSTGGS
ncbi:ESPR domain-containing protein, partial [Buttiauxella gaviniae]|uniref:ESPR domain-containing protein n=1 Tax=Buttiauxella gaviniae TaxID=82990 RepID=UPI001AE018C3